MFHEIAEEKFAAPFLRPLRASGNENTADDALADERRVRVQRLLECGICGKAFGQRPSIIRACDEVVYFFERASAHVSEEYPLRFRLCRETERIANSVCEDRAIFALGSCKRRVVRRNRAIRV